MTFGHIISFSFLQRWGGLVYDPYCSRLSGKDWDILGLLPSACPQSVTWGWLRPILASHYSDLFFCHFVFTFFAFSLFFLSPFSSLIKWIHPLVALPWSLVMWHLTLMLPLTLTRGRGVRWMMKFSEKSLQSWISWWQSTETSLLRYHTYRIKICVHNQMY